MVASDRPFPKPVQLDLLPKLNQTTRLQSQKIIKSKLSLAEQTTKQEPFWPLQFFTSFLVSLNHFIDFLRVFQQILYS